MNAARDLDLTRRVATNDRFVFVPTIQHPTVQLHYTILRTITLETGKPVAR